MRSRFSLPDVRPIHGLMRRVLVLLTLVATMVPAIPASALSNDPWVFEGGGWGHGVGLSQFGSQAMAVNGYDAAGIIDFYYSGADVKGKDTVGAQAWLDGEEAIWVGIAQNQTSRTFRAIGDGISICVFDDTDNCDAPLSPAPNELVTVAVVEGDPSHCEVTIEAETPVPGKCKVDITWPEDPMVRRVRTGGLEYARGSIRIRPNDVVSPDGFHVSVSVGLEKYIYGIAETLLQWDVEALKTQAIIARSYGVRKALDRANADGSLPDSRKNTCWCHLVASTADQNYDGWSGALATEGDPTYGQKWRDAVDETAGQIVTHPSVNNGNTIISTFYSSSNGGATENNEDVWGGSPVVYLRSVIDPWSIHPDAANPLAHWTINVSDEDMATALGWDRALDAFVLQGPPGLLVKFTGFDGGVEVSKTLNGTDIASILKTYGVNAEGGSVRVSPYIATVTDPPGFDDIIGSIFEGDIEWLAGVGVTKGCNPPKNTLFCPDDAVSREVMAAFLNRYLQLPPASKDYFTDDNGSIFEDDINRIAEVGITKGCNPPDNDHFCPERTVDRGQMAAFLVRALGLTDNGGGNLFTDDDGSVFENDIDKLGTAGVTKGCNPPQNDHFCPTGIVNRAQMAAFLHRADGL
jgi:peptidoglycan hydrolase-like amidase